LQWLELFVNRNPGAMEGIACPIQGNPANRKNRQDSWIWHFETVSALGGAVQAFRPRKISGKIPRPHTVSRLFVLGWRVKRE